MDITLEFLNTEIRVLTQQREQFVAAANKADGATQILQQLKTHLLADEPEKAPEAEAVAPGEPDAETEVD